MIPSSENWREASLFVEGFCEHLPITPAGPFSAGHGYNACWSNPMQSLVRTNASDWSGRMQTGGQVERNFAQSMRNVCTDVIRGCDEKAACEQNSDGE